MKKLAEEHHLGLHVHVASVSTGEIEEAHANNNLGYAITGAHCVWLGDREVETMAKTGMKAVHCPTYKLSYSADSKVTKFGDGIAPISDMVAKGITTGLGTDGCMGDTHDMFREMRNLAFTQHYKMRDKTLFPPTKLLEMVTIDCAKTLSWHDQIGSIEPGKRADIIIVDSNQANTVPWTNPAACLVYLASGLDVETVIIEGKIIMKDRRIDTVDQAEVLDKAQSAAEALIERAGFEDLVSHGFDPWCSDYKL
jgi:5-methylthioadenosine/S-adenosylhomocysteine deaminase